MDKEKEEKECKEKPFIEAESEALAEVAEATAEVVQTDDPKVDEASDMARLIEEAESRGYLRGRNARIEELMSEPGMYRPLGVEEHGGAALPPTEILSNMRRSVWD